jgi:hypothetical protein
VVNRESGAYLHRFRWLDDGLIGMDYRLRKSYRKGTVNALVSITKIFERGVETVRGFFGRKR